MRKFLKGLARLRREMLNPSLSDVIPNAKIYDRWGEPIPNAVAYHTSNPIHSLTMLGEGSFAKVYALDEDRVLKVCTPGSDLKYGEYVALIKGRTNKHMPRIYYTGKWGDKNVYVMERLHPNLTDDMSLQNLIHSFKSLRDVVEIKDPETKELVELLVDNNLTDDCYGRNIMKRADGTSVVTDPVAG